MLVLLAVLATTGELSTLCRGGRTRLLTGDRMSFIEVNGAALRFDLVGSGASTLVLVHEMGGTLESWDPVLPTLSARRRVLRYDTRGAGLSQKVRGALAI